ncbi:MAG: hypothetical protein HWQ38_18990 [Nostoc sp. NMS7]|uniref:hypothetical protein n=1 Tax=Nostoc sp. NMS7 TaxID=2815391 RepID=UPI0025CDF32B|nr:hypothetical protein [Nostoc sp. NMS7]MBN3948423.1 hypothetical protein [Nostoc sp. NMS7]
MIQDFVGNTLAKNELAHWESLIVEYLDLWKDLTYGRLSPWTTDILTNAKIHVSGIRFVTEQYYWQKRQQYMKSKKIKGVIVLHEGGKIILYGKAHHRILRGWTRLSWNKIKPIFDLAVKKWWRQNTECHQKCS